MPSQERPLVSVIIAFHNEETFLGETVESVLRQDYPNWELLLVDDGSTNKSTDIAKRIAAAHPDKVFYLEHKGHANKGVCVSRNLGVEKARGELVALLDADDVWLPGKLSDQVAIFQRHPEIAMVAEASNYWHSWCQSPSDDLVIPVGAPAGRVYQPAELLYLLYPLGTGVAPCPSGLMLRKEAVQRSGGFEEAFHGRLQLYEDQAFLCKLYLHEKVYVSASCNNLYRQHPASVVKRVHAAGQYHMVRQYFLEWFKEYLQQRHLTDQGLHRLLRKALMPYHQPLRHYILVEMPQKALAVTKRALPGPVKKLIR
ncbi:MAG: glycosyltransferase family 2 protein [Hymenobacteraceae bacterium]|nr:glycosyltransferase family 2 protein [Hymenobacteraceae bacterium]